MITLQPKTFVIALKNHNISQQQLQKCLESAKEHNWNIEISWAVNGLNVTDETWKNLKIVPLLHKKTMDKKGVQGCFLSHYALWKKCIELKEPIVILEHDAVILKPWQPISLNQGLLKLHKIFKGSNKIDDDTGRWTKSGHAYCLLPEHAERIINFVHTVGAIPADILIGDKVVPFRHIDKKISIVDRQNTHSTTNNIEYDI